jgi:flagellar hook protein FlgE
MTDEGKIDGKYDLGGHLIMMRSLFSGVSGLRTHQTRMDVIGNNIANVNTTAFKAKQMNFSDMLYQTTQAATGANAANGTGGTNPRQIGLGVKAAAINTTITQEGANQSTGNPFDLKISGEAFFVVSDGTSTYYTRDGSFDVDDAGNLCMASTGYIVQGWGVDKEGNIVKGTVGPINTKASNEYNADATKNAQIAGIIDKDDSDLQNKDGKIVNFEVYDSAGYPYNLKFGILPATSISNSTREVTNTESIYHMPANIYKVDTSKLSFSYPVNGETKDLATIDSPEATEKLIKDIWAEINGTKSTAAGYQDIIAAGTHTFGKDDEITVDLSKFFANNPDLNIDPASDLLNITALTVKFSGETGYVPNNTVDYPISDATKVADEVAKLLYNNTDSTTHTDGFVSCGLAGAVTVAATSQTYVDDNGDTVTKWKFETVDGTNRKTLQLTDAQSDAMRKLLQLKASDGKTQQYTTTETMQDSAPIPGQYTIKLLGMTDSNKVAVDVSSILDDSVFTVQYDTGNGEFQYVDSMGNSTFTINLSTINDRGNFENVTVDMSGTKNVGNDHKSTVEGKRLDGTKVGKLLGVSVGTDGIVTASYSNGHITRLGQICVAKFANAMGLENSGDNLYQTTASSGDASLVDIKAEGIGSITSGILEMSNVDLSQQFTDMITTQRGFQANSRTITVSDTLLEELINLKR